MKNKTTGFTLIELLTVIAIIGILAAILIPVVGAVRESAKTAKCSSNLRSIGGALHAYALDHGHLPIAANVQMSPRIRWFNVLEPYMGTPDLDPDSTDRLEWQQCPAMQPHEPTPVAHYGWNYLGFGQNPPGPGETPGNGFMSRIEQVAEPSRTLIVADAQDHEPTWQWVLLHRNSTGSRYARRHNGEGNYLFVDGHVEKMTPEEVVARDQADPSLFFHR